MKFRNRHLATDTATTWSGGCVMGSVIVPLFIGLLLASPVGAQKPAAGAVIEDAAPESAPESAPEGAPDGDRNSDQDKGPDGAEPVDIDAVAAAFDAVATDLAEIDADFRAEESANLVSIAAELLTLRDGVLAENARLDARIAFLRQAFGDAAAEAQANNGRSGGVQAFPSGPAPASADGAAAPATETRPAQLSEEQRARLAALRDSRSRGAALLGAIDSLSADVAERRRLNEFRRGVDARRAEISEIQQLLASGDGVNFVAIRERLRGLKTEAAESIRPLQETRSALDADLQRLGPAPVEGGAPEAPEIATQREKLTASLVREDAVVRQSDLNVGEIDRMLAEIDELRRDQFYEEVLRRSPSPVMPNMLAGAAEAFGAGVNAFLAAARQWRNERAAEGVLWNAYGMTALGLLIGVVLFGPTRRWANRQVITRLEEREPTAGRRAGAALVRVFARAVPGFIGGAIVFQALRSQGVITPEVAPFARCLWFGFLALLVVDAGTVAAFAPGTPGWRLVPLATRGVGIARGAFTLVTFLFFADRALTAGASAFGADDRLALVQSALVAILMGFIFLGLSHKSVWRLAEGREEATPQDSFRIGRNVRLLVRFVALAAILATVSGYVSLGHYLSTRTFMLGGLAAGALFVRLIAQQGLQALGRTVSTASAEGENQERLIFFWIGAVLDLLIVLSLAPVIALILGAEWEDVRGWVSDAFFGFKVGGVTISIAQIFIALGIFIGILTITRFIQGLGEKRFLPRTRLDTGLQNSLKTLIGYVGLVIAFAAAVSALGFNLSNLAIIAGALSVGIGFGLQSIVNNFVSGLILLFERPIKVGDWVVTSSGEGIVKKISVRSTEIETFDRSSVILPNSELISNAVVNWTHKDKLGRVIIAVGVSYDSDPEEVIRLLEEVGRESSAMVSYPAPYVYFVGFGDSSLDFELRGIIRDVNSGLSAKTALRVAVFKKLKGAGIEIPFPQRDLNIRSGLYPVPEGMPPGDGQGNAADASPAAARSGPASRSAG
ncbi:MAG: DUF3772 domain-containing protein [Alphaproteobacteria bacterium]|nr:DUF3772 domain-containing protein [Alphaproteobacteria bacterium]